MPATLASRAPAPVHRWITIHERRRLYESAVALITRECATELDLASVAARLYTSRRQLQRVLSEAGTSFRAVLRRARMTTAAHLLRTHPEMTVREISEAVGYRQPAQFAKAFRAACGLSPTEYRHRHRSH